MNAVQAEVKALTMVRAAWKLGHRITGEQVKKLAGAQAAAALRRLESAGLIRWDFDGVQAGSGGWRPV